MPRSRTTKRRYGRKRRGRGTRKRYRRKRRYMRALANLQPKTKLVKHPWAERLILTSGAGKALSESYIANGLYDTLGTANTHQPVGFDEMSALYDHHTVLSAKIWLECATEHSAADFYMGILVSDSPDFQTGQKATDMMERGGSNWTLVVNSTVGGSIATARLSRAVSIPKFLGVSPAAMTADNRLKASGNNLPTERVYFHVWIAPTNDASTIANQDITVRIEMVTLWSEPKLHVGS